MHFGKTKASSTTSRTDVPNIHTFCGIFTNIAVGPLGFHVELNDGPEGVPAHQGRSYEVTNLDVLEGGGEKGEGSRIVLRDRTGVNRELSVPNALATVPTVGESSRSKRLGVDSSSPGRGAESEIAPDKDTAVRGAAPVLDLREEAAEMSGPLVSVPEGLNAELAQYQVCLRGSTEKSPPTAHLQERLVADTVSQIPVLEGILAARASDTASDDLSRCAIVTPLRLDV
jgi:hypothetical protein